MFLIQKTPLSFKGTTPVTAHRVGKAAGGVDDGACVHLDATTSQLVFHHCPHNTLLVVLRCIAADCLRAMPWSYCRQCTAYKVRQ